MPAGRTTKCTPEVMETICSEVAIGNNIQRLCSEREDLPAARTIYRWLVNESDYPEFCQMYARARESRANVRFDEIDDIIRKTASGEYHPNQARVMIDAIKWQMGKENRIYSDNRHEFNVTSDISEDLEARLNRAKEMGRKSIMGEQARLEMLKNSVDS